MAVYKGREVTILGRATGADYAPDYRVLDQWGQEEIVTLDKLQVTEEEKKQLTADNQTNLTFNVIKDKDLKDLRDSQDAEKIKARQEKGELTSKEATPPMPVKIVEDKKTK